MHSCPDSHSELTCLASLSTASFSLRHLFSSRLWVVCLLRSAVWYLQYDDANGDCSGPVRGDHQASRLPGHDVSQESPEHCGCCLGLLNGLEHAPLLWLEWVWPGNWVVIDQCDSSQGFSLLSYVFLSGSLYLCQHVKFLLKVVLLYQIDLTSPCQHAKYI